MAIVRYEPFRLLDQFQRELSRLGSLDLFSGQNLDEDTSNIATSNWAPAVDIKEDKDRFVIIADVPGVDPKDIEVTMENGMLTIRGKRNEEKEEDRNGYRRVERVRGTFYRRFSLPDTADAERIEAHGKNGVLEIVLPKHEKLQPRKISVHG